MRARVLFILLFGAAIGIGGWFGSSQTMVDLVQDRVSSEAWRAGGDPYDPTVNLLLRYEHYRSPSSDVEQTNPHPPALIIALTPVTMLPPRMAHVILAFLETGALLGSMMLLLRRFELPAWLAGVPFLFPFVQMGLANGTVSNLILLAVVAAGLKWEKSHDAAAGAFLGLAAAVKIYPILLVVVFAASRRWRAAMWAVGTTAFLASLSFLMIGPAHAWRWVHEVAPADVAGWSGWKENISLAAPLYRVLGWHSSIALIVVVLAVVVILRLDYWGASPWAVLAAPIAWPHYAVLALPAILRVARRYPIAAFGIAVALSAGVNGIAPWFATLALLGLGLWPLIRSTKARVASAAPRQPTL